MPSNDLSRTLSDDEQALQSAMRPFVEEIRRLGFNVLGTYRVALIGKRRDTVLRAKVSQRGHFVVDSPVSETFGLHQFETAEEAIAFLVASARTEAFNAYAAPAPAPA